MKIFCVIPAFNERGNLEKLIRLLVTEFNRTKINYTIFFVLQGQDGSKELLDSLKNKYPQVKYLYYLSPLGIGKAYQKGFRKVYQSTTHILTLDADLNHNPKDIHRFIRTLLSSQFDVAIGSRFIPGGRFQDPRPWKRFMSTYINALVRFLLRIPIRDITSGYRFMKKKVVTKTLPFLHESGYPFYMEFILRAHNLGFTMTEIPITYRARTWGKSKIGKRATFLEYMKFLSKVLF